MKSRLVFPPAAMLVVLMFAIALVTIVQLPADSRIVVHWGSDGEPDGWMGKWAGMLLIPLVSTIAWLPTAFTTRDGPGMPGQTALTLPILLIALTGECLTAATALGYTAQANRSMLFAVGILFLAIGAVFAGLARNAAAPDHRRNRIHIACRWIFSLWGYAIVIAALLAPPPAPSVAAVLLILAAPAIALLFACLEWHRTPG